MELPLVNESPASPASYSLDHVWPHHHPAITTAWVMPLSIDNTLDDESTLTHQSHSATKRTAPTAHPMNSSGYKRLKGIELKDEKRILKEEGGNTSVTSGKHAKLNKRATEESKLDYIHVRARRGQATDSHSLAERARREKIGERMKLLQDLVPGCKKVVGKAVVLDEIINYVLSLQHQVEFLSMKLEAINSSILPKAKTLPAKNLEVPGFDSAGMVFPTHPTSEYGQGPQSNCQQIHLGGNLQRATQ